MMNVIKSRKLAYYTLTISLLTGTAYGQNATLTETVTSADQINTHLITSTPADHKLLTLASDLTASTHFNPLSNGLLTLDGSDEHFTLHGDGKMGFQVFSNGNLSLRDISLEGFSFASAGGAVSNKGTLTSIENVDFTANSASASSDVKGGALYNAADMGDISGRFLDNKAISSNASAFGGALYHAADLAKHPRPALFLPTFPITGPWPQNPLPAAPFILMLQILSSPDISRTMPRSVPAGRPAAVLLPPISLSLSATVLLTIILHKARPAGLRHAAAPSLPETTSRFVPMAPKPSSPITIPSTQTLINLSTPSISAATISSRCKPQTAVPSVLTTASTEILTANILWISKVTEPERFPLTMPCDRPNTSRSATPS